MPLQSNDLRVVAGACVETKAMFVTAMAECSRRFGTNAKTKVVPGVVVSVRFESPPGRTRTTTFIIANYYFGPNDVKQGKVNIRSVTAVECSQLHEELKEILRQRESPINSMVVSPPPAANAPNIRALQPSQATPASARDDGSSTTPTAASRRTPPGTTTPTTLAANDLRATNDDEGSSPAALIYHETEWFEADPTVLEQDMNGPESRTSSSHKVGQCGST